MSEKTKGITVGSSSSFNFTTREWTRRNHFTGEMMLTKFVDGIEIVLRQWNRNDEVKKRTINPKLRFEILARDNFTCQCCGRTPSDGVKLEVDHRHPKAEGGTDDKSNLWTLCFECNRGKKDKMIPVLINRNVN